MTSRISRREAFIAEMKANRELSNERFAYLQRMTEEVDRRYRERFEALDRAVTKSEQQMDRRFEAITELRQVISDQARTFMPRSEIVAVHDALEGKIEQTNRTTSARLEAVAKTISDLANVMTALRSSLAGQDEGEMELQAQIEQRQKERERSRNLGLGVLAAAVGLGGLFIGFASIGVALFLGLRTPKSATPAPPPATTVPAVVVPLPSSTTTTTR